MLFILLSVPLVINFSLADPFILFVVIVEVSMTIYIIFDKSTGCVLAKVAPKAIFNVGTSKKYLFDFLGKTVVRGYSEAIEEGKQYEYGRKFSQGEFAGKSNTFLSTLMDDLSTGLYTGLAFVGHQFFGMQSDKELMSNMRGGFIGGVLNHGTAITAVQDITNARGEIKAGDLIFNNVMAEKLRQRSNIINGEEMAKYASRTGYVAMMNAFDRV
jgi:hypothetical protein